MTPENGRLAHEAIQRAAARAGRAAAHEQALIRALAARYGSNPRAERAPLDRAYADAMRAVASRFPDDPEIQTLLADAVMNTMPWDYWTKDGSAKPATAEIIGALESVMAKHPDHAGAHHYFIHVMEASNDPDRAVPSAERLGSLMPAAGHMVHMPAHIFIRVGRYADAAEANVRAIAADEDYLAQCQVQGLYPISYYPHNLHFLWAAATLEGRSAVAIEAARSTAAKVPHHHAGALAWTADYPVTPMLAHVRFGRWREALIEPAPPAREPYATGIWHYARGLAFIAEGRLDRARAELTALTRAMGHEAFTTTLKDLPLLTNLRIASRIVEGELAARTDRTRDAIRLVEEAVALEDAIPYSEPPVWHQPPRQVLGAILLEAGRAADAERVYTEDLQRFRENGWSLFGLMQSLSAQGRSAEAVAVRRRFETAWARADITLTASRIMGRPEAAPSHDTAGTPAPARRSVSLHNEVALDYVEQGDPNGTPVIFLHGVTDSWRSFEPVLPHLPPSVRALSITQRGHGESAKPAAGYRFADLADDVLHFMDALHIPRAVIVGHSMGAGVAQRFAIDRPDRTAGVVLIGSFARLTANPGIKELYESTISKMTDPVDRSIAADFQLSTVARPIPAASMEAFIDESLKVPARVWRALFANFLEEDFSRELPRIGTPALLLWGDRDAFVGRDDQQALTAAIRRSRLVVYEGVGHAVHWEAPARVARDLVSFVEEAAGR